jgi:hypothetical protein
MTAVPACVWAHVRVREREWEVRVAMRGGYQIFHNFWRYRIFSSKKSQKQCYIVRFLLAAENILLYSVVLTGCRKSPVIFAGQLKVAEIYVGHRKTVDFLLYYLEMSSKNIKL